MGFKAKDWDFICTEYDGGVYDMMIYNPTTKELYVEEDIEEEYISGVDSYGNPYTAAKISGETFDIIQKKMMRDGGAHMGFFIDWDDDEDFAPKLSPTGNKEKVPADLVRKGIRGELSPSELDKIVQVELERADYYDFDAFINMIHRFMRGEVSEGYYHDWVILVAWAMGANKCRENSKRYLLYQSISDCFDGDAFTEFEDGKEHECLEMIAFLKHYNHQLQNIQKSTEPPFYNEDGTAVYVCFEYCNQENVFYRLCVANEKTESFKITYIANPFYFEHINYTFVSGDDFDDLAGTYYEYFHDISIDIHDYIGERPFLDVDGNEVK